MILTQLGCRHKANNGQGQNCAQLSHGFFLSSCFKFFEKSPFWFGLDDTLSLFLILTLC